MVSVVASTGPPAAASEPHLEFVRESGDSRQCRLGRCAAPSHLDRTRYTARGPPTAAASSDHASVLGARVAVLAEQVQLGVGDLPGREP